MKVEAGKSRTLDICGGYRVGQVVGDACIIHIRKDGLFLCKYGKGLFRIHTKEELDDKRSNR
jgi:hypothetical protein